MRAPHEALLRRSLASPLASDGLASLTSIQFWAALPEPDNSVMQDLIKQYNASNPYRPVHYTNYVSPEKLLDALQYNPPPNLALIDSNWIGSLKPKLVPAEDMLLAAGEMAKTMTEADTFVSIWNSCVVNGKVYAIPFSSETAALVLNGSFFKKFPVVPDVQKWSKLAVLSASFKKNVWGIVLPLSWDAASLGQLWTDFSSSFASTQDSKPGTKEELASLNVWWNWANRSRVSPPTPDEVPSEFSRGCTWVLLPRQLASIKGKFAVKPLPRIKKPWSYLHVQAVAFFSKDNSWDFANYLTSYKQLKFWAMNTPTVPVNKQVYLSPDYLSQIDAQRSWMRVYISAVVHAIPSYNFPNAPQVLEETGEILLKSLHNEITEQDAVKRIQDLLNSVSVVMEPCA